MHVSVSSPTPAQTALSLHLNSTRDGPSLVSCRADAEGGALQLSAVTRRGQTLLFGVTAPIPGQGNSDWFNLTVSMEYVVCTSSTTLPSGDDTLRALFVADVNSDGAEDVVMGTSTGYLQWVDLQTSVVSRVYLGTGSSRVQHLACADFDFDADIDCVAYLESDTRGSVLVENVDGAGTFKLRGTFDPFSDNRYGGAGLTLCDIVGDGTADDVVVSSLSQRELFWYESLGNLTFDGPHRISPPENVANENPAVCADLNGDGLQDLLQVGGGSDRILWYENSGTRSFTEHVVSTTISVQATMAVVGDLDNDGDLDFVVSSTFSPYVLVHRNLDGLGNFSAAESIGISFRTDDQGLALVDVDADGFLDIVCSPSSGSTSRIYFNDGFGAFPDYITMSTHDASTIIVDLDHDSYTDMLYASGDNPVQVEWGFTARPLPKIDANRVSIALAVGRVAVFDVRPTRFFDIDWTVRESLCPSAEPVVSSGTTQPGVDGASRIIATLPQADNLMSEIDFCLTLQPVGGEATDVSFTANAAVFDNRIAAVAITNSSFTFDPTLLRQSAARIPPQVAAATITVTRGSAVTLHVNGRSESLADGVPSEPLTFTNGSRVIDVVLATTTPLGMDPLEFRFSLLRVQLLDPVAVLFNPTRDSVSTRVNRWPRSALKYVRLRRVIVGNDNAPPSLALRGDINMDLLDIFLSMTSGQDLFVCRNQPAFEAAFVVPTGARVVQWPVGGDLWADDNHEGVRLEVGGVTAWALEFDSAAPWAAAANGGGVAVVYVDSDTLAAANSAEALAVEDPLELRSAWSSSNSISPGAWVAADGDGVHLFCRTTNTLDCLTNVQWDAASSDIRDSNRLGTSLSLVRNVGTSVVRSADFDGDGDLDLFLSEGNIQFPIRIYENAGDGNFTLRYTHQDSFRRVDSPDDMDLADLDGDGLVDIVIASWSRFPTKMVVLWNLGGLQFQEELLTNPGYPVFALAIDYDLDGDLDVIGYDDTADKVVFWENQGARTFGSREELFTLNNQVKSGAAADIDGDDLPDLVLFVAFTGVEWFSNLNQTSPRFSAGTSLLSLTSSSDGQVLVASMDKAGGIDVVVGPTFPRQVSVLKNDGSATFDPPIDITLDAQSTDLTDVVLDGSRHIAVALFDGVTIADTSTGLSQHVSTASELTYSITPLSSPGDLAVGADHVTVMRFLGKHSAAGFLYSTEPATAPAVGDFDGDGSIDVVTAPYWATCGGVFFGTDTEVAHIEHNCTMPGEQDLPRVVLAGNIFESTQLDDLLVIRDSDSRLRAFRNTGASSFSIQATASLDAFGSIEHAVLLRRNVLVVTSAEPAVLQVTRASPDAGSFVALETVYTAVSSITALLRMDDSNVLLALSDTASLVWLKVPESSPTSATEQVSFAALAGIDVDPSTAEITSMAVGDLLGLGRRDIVFVWDEVTYLVAGLDKDRGAVGFATPIATEALRPRPLTLAVADIDGNGRADIITGAAVLRTDNTPFVTSLVLDSTHELSSFDMGDVDGDGTADIVVLAPGRVLFLRGTPNSDNRFAPEVEVYNSTRTSLLSRAKVVLVDVNGDGRLDAVVCASGFNDADVFWLPNLGGADVFGPAVVLATDASRLGALAVCDLTGDGILDAVILGGSEEPVRLFRGTGLGFSGVMETLGPSGEVFDAHLSRFLGCADLDQDGDNDLFYASKELEFVWLENRFDEDGSLGPVHVVDGGAANVDADMIAGLIDDDNIVDLLTISSLTNTIKLHRGLGSGSFAAGTVVAAASQDASLANTVLVDVDGSSAPDLVVANAHLNGDIKLAVNEGNGEFSSLDTMVPDISGGTRHIRVLDWDGDGDKDALSTSSGNLYFHQAQRQTYPDSSSSIGCTSDDVVYDFASPTASTLCTITARAEGSLVSTSASVFPFTIVTTPDSAQAAVTVSPLSPALASVFEFNISSSEAVSVVIQSPLLPYYAVNFSYPPPAVELSSLHLVEGSGTTTSGGGRVVLATSAPVVIGLNVSNVGTNPDSVRVTYGPNGDTSLFECQVLRISGTGVFGTVSCLTQGQEELDQLQPLLFTVVVNGQASAVDDETNILELAAAPQVTRVEGCDAVEGAATTGCPLSGGIPLTVHGERLGVNGTTTILIGSRLCRTLEVHPPSNLTCLLPASQGGVQLVTASTTPEVCEDSVIYGSPRALVAYRVPVILALSADESVCTDSQQLHLSGCSRQGDSGVITITGQNLGSIEAGVQATVGGADCSNPQESTTPEALLEQLEQQLVAANGVVGGRISSMTCELPSGTLTNQQVQVLDVSGRPSEAQALVSFEQCPAGFYSNGTLCEPCGEGTYAPQAGHEGQCLLCEQGTFANRTGAIVCASCPAGTASSAFGASECTLCVPGRWQANEGRTSCDACAAGRFAAGNGTAQLCEACPAGSVAPLPAQSGCASCTPGRFAVDGVLCDLCEVGRFSNASDSVECTACEAGSYAALPGRTECELCEPGRYQTAGSADGCVVCPPGRFTSDNGTAQLCETCPTGRVAQFSGASECVSCQPGTATTDRLTCEACEVGRFSNASDSVECTACEAGSFAPIPGRTECELCEPGRYQTAGTADGCVACPPGRYAPDNGTAQLCEACLTGRVAQFSGASECVSCQPGTATTDRLTCEACEVGRFSNVSDSVECTACEAGSFAPIPGRTKCELCEPGRYQTASNADDCVACPPGRYAPDNGTAQLCETCPTGRVAQFSGTSECVSCQPGTATTDRLTCEACEVGRFSNASDSVECTACEAGSFAPIPGRTECELCEPGRYQTAGTADECLACPPGRFASDTGRGTLCEACPGGAIAQASGSTECLECGAGSVATDGVECTLCTAGTFANVSENRCSQCPAGKAAPNAGSTFCEACARGRYQLGNTPSSCLACPPGRYGDDEGRQTLCEVCATGYRSLTAGATSCVPCGRGQVTKDAITCELCPEGTYSNVSAATSCRACERNSFAPGKASSECASCPALQFTAAGESGRGRTSCLQCDGNTYVRWADGLGGAGHPNRTRSTCASCPPGSDCAGGSVVAEDGSWVVADARGSVESFVCLPGRCVACPDSDPEGAESVAVACCTENREPAESNPMCARCASGFVEWGGECIECKETQYAVLALILVVMGLLVFLMHAGLNQQSNPLALVFFYYMQMVLIIFGEETEWLAWASFFNFNPLQNAGGGTCVAPWSPMTKMIISALSPVLSWGFLAIAAAGHTLLHVFQEGPTDFSALWAPYWRSCIAFYIFCYNNIANESIKFFGCQEVAGGRWNVVRSNPDIDCDSDEYKRAQPLFACCLVFVVVSPLVVLYWLRMPTTRRIADRHLSESKADAEQQADMPSKNSVHIWSILFENFAGHSSTVTYHWNVVILIRRVLIVATATVALQYGRPTRYAAITLSHVGALVVHMLFVPYRDMAMDGTFVESEKHRTELQAQGLYIVPVNAIETISLVLLVIFSTCVGAAGIPLSYTQAVVLAMIVFTWQGILLVLMVLRMRSKRRSAKRRRDAAKEASSQVDLIDPAWGEDSEDGELDEDSIELTNMEHRT